MKSNLRLCRFCEFAFDKQKTLCPSCHQWNIEKQHVTITDDGTFALSEADEKTVELIPTGPWDLCFGRDVLPNGKYVYGFPRSSVTMLGGKNGAGKSTLVLQAADKLVEATGLDVLIVSVEEAAAQVKRLAKRLQLKNIAKIRISKGDRDLGEVLRVRKYTAIFVDSLPKLCPDTNNAVEFCKRLKEHVEDLCIPAVVINHINKEEEFAGLEALQHEVDANLIFTVYDDEVRELSSKKNRNAPHAKVLFNMTDKGLVERTEEEDKEDDEDD